MIRENLLPSHRIEARRVSRAARAWAMLLGSGAIVVAFGGLGTQVATSAPRTMPVSLQHQLEATRAELGVAQELLALVERTHEASRLAQSTPDWSALLTVIAKEAQGRVVLRAIGVQPAADGTWSISLVGHTDDRQRVLEVRTGLEATGLFANLRSGTAQGVTQQGSIEFHIDGQLSPGASR